MINILLTKSYDFSHLLTYLGTKRSSLRLEENNHSQYHVSMLTQSSVIM